MNLLVLPGDDIGPEITAAALTVLERTNALFSLISLGRFPSASSMQCSPTLHSEPPTSAARPERALSAQR